MAIDTTDESGVSIERISPGGYRFGQGNFGGGFTRPSSDVVLGTVRDNLNDTTLLHIFKGAEVINGCLRQLTLTEGAC